MTEIIAIRFKREGKQYYFDPGGQTVKPGDGVILETSWGVEYGECVQGNHQVSEASLVAPLRTILRLATPADMETVRKNRKKEAQAMQLCQQKIQEHALEMKLVDVEYSFEGTKILFFFTSEGRVDFRNLVKDLASVFHTRIELRQIGVRDEAKMLGGLGICGREFCCSSFLREFQPVSIKMAKTQSLSLNPTKISGTCGRLMCCLKYEQLAYEDLLKSSPKADSFVETPDGVGNISSVYTLREQVRVRLDNAPDTLKTYHNSEVRVVRSGKGKRPDDYTPPPPHELEKLRRPVEPSEETDALGRSLQRFVSEPTSFPPAEPPRPERQNNRGRGGERRDRRSEGERNRSNRPQQEPRKTEPAEAASAPANEQNAESNRRRGNRGGRGRGGGKRPGNGQQTQPQAAQTGGERQSAPAKPGEGQGNRRSHPKPRNNENQKAAENKKPKNEQKAPEGKSGEGSKNRRPPPWRKRGKPGGGEQQPKPKD